MATRQELCPDRREQGHAFCDRCDDEAVALMGPDRVVRYLGWERVTKAKRRLKAGDSEAFKVPVK